MPYTNLVTLANPGDFMLVPTANPWLATTTHALYVYEYRNSDGNVTRATYVALCLRDNTRFGGSADNIVTDESVNCPECLGWLHA